MARQREDEYSGAYKYKSPPIKNLDFFIKI